MQPGAMLFFHLFDRKYFTTQARQLGKLLLDFLQPFLPQAVSDLRLCAIPAMKPVFFVLPLNLRNLDAQIPDLSPQNFEMIHAT